MPKVGYPPGFYVYRLVDPRNCLPFCVGKGQRDRAWQHQRSVEAAPDVGHRRVSGKNTRIRQILMAGMDVEVEIVASYVNEADAFDHEYRLIDADPTLTNVVPGGGASPAVLERRRKAREAAAERDRAKARSDKIKRTTSKLMCVPNSDLHGDVIGEWAERVVDRRLFKARLTPQEKAEIRQATVKELVRKGDKLEPGQEFSRIVNKQVNRKNRRRKRRNQLAKKAEARASLAAAQ